MNILKILRLKHKATQKDVAEFLCKDSTFISKLETGAIPMHYLSVGELCQLEQLFQLGDDNPLFHAVWASFVNMHPWGAEFERRAG